VFPELPDYLDIGCCRFIPFVDLNVPGFCARRTVENIEKMGRLAKDWNGPVVSLQHVPLFFSGDLSPTLYVNRDAIKEVAKCSGVTHAISGHEHKGGYVKDDVLTSIISPALRDKPFKFLEIHIEDNGETEIVEHSLANDSALNLSDNHIHSPLAYCSENMDIERIITLQDAMNLNRISFTEHTAHLMMDIEAYRRFAKTGVGEYGEYGRFQDYYNMLESYRSESIRIGFEVDCDKTGTPMLSNEDRQKADFILGSLHYFPRDMVKTVEDSIDAYKYLATIFLQTPMDVFTHPFRIFRRFGFETPRELFPFLVNLLKQHHIAVELNFHTNEPSLEFFEMCLDKEIKISLGSDAHNLYEVGEFYPHLEFLKKLGCNQSDFEHILLY
jgi:histidinol phosphatase-like PHP family hydrolase